MQPEEAQAKPKAQNALHDPAVASPREEVQREAVLERRREGRVLIIAAPYGDTGKNLLLLFPIRMVDRILLNLIQSALNRQ
jgi:hypothetical protein